MARLVVVPWSIARMYRLMRIPLLLAFARGHEFDTVRIPHHGDRQLDLRGAALRVPAQPGADQVDQLLEQRLRDSAGEGQAGASQNEVDEVDDRFVLRKVRDLAARVVRGMFEGYVVVLLHPGDDAQGTGSVASEQLFGPFGSESATVRVDPALPCGSRAREVASASDLEAVGGDPSRHVQEFENSVAEVRGEGTEGGPLATHQTQEGAASQVAPLDAVIARNESGRLVIVPRKGAY